MLYLSQGWRCQSFILWQQLKKPSTQPATLLVKVKTPQPVPLRVVLLVMAYCDPTGNSAYECMGALFVEWDSSTALPRAMQTLAAGGLSFDKEPALRETMSVQPCAVESWRSRIIRPLFSKAKSWSKDSQKAKSPHGPDQSLSDTR